MDRSAQEIMGWTAAARGGPAGVVRDLLVDDRDWEVRYLTVETLSLARVRHALVLPRAVRRLNAERRRFELSLEQWEVAAAPDIEYDPPIAVQQEQASYDARGWRYYLREPEAVAPAPAGEIGIGMPPRTRARQSNDPHLRSLAVMTGYAVDGSDGPLGPLRDFVVDDKRWRVVSLVVGGALGVAVPIERVSAVDWATSLVRVSLSTREAAALSPPAERPGDAGAAA